MKRGDFSKSSQVLCSRIMHYSSAMMTAKDSRIKLMTELLQGVKSLKFSALEAFFAHRINLHREVELDNLKGRVHFRLLNR